MYYLWLGWNSTELLNCAAICGNVNANFVKLHNGGYDLLYFGTINNSIIQDFKDEQCIRISDFHNLKSYGSLFSLKEKYKYDELNKGFETFAGKISGIPYARTGSIEKLKQDIVDNSLTPLPGDSVFVTTLKKPVWWDGTKWVDATGAQV